MPIINKQDLAKMGGSAPGVEVSILVDAEKGSHTLRIGEVTIAPNSRIPRHIHTTVEEAMIILEGTLDAQVGNDRMTVGPGHTVLAPPGTTHGFVNRSQEPARLLFVFPTLQPDRVLSSVPGATSGFPSTTGRSGYESPQDRPLG